MMYVLWESSRGGQGLAGFRGVKFGRLAEVGQEAGF